MSSPYTKIEKQYQSGIVKDVIFFWLFVNTLALFIGIALIIALFSATPTVSGAGLFIGIFYITILVLPLCLTALIAGIQFFRRRQWGRNTFIGALVGEGLLGIGAGFYFLPYFGKQEAILPYLLLGALPLLVIITIVIIIKHTIY